MRWCFLLAACALEASAQSPDKVALEWHALGQGAVVRPAAGPTETEHGAIAIEYDSHPARVSGAVTPAPAGLAHMARLRFWAKSDQATALGVVLAEGMPGGGRYTAWAWLPAGAWQSIGLDPRDFIPNDGPQDPVDADGKLDLDAVENIALLDLGQFFGSAPRDSPLPVEVDRATGKHTLLIGSLELLTTAAADEAPGTVDSFGRGFLQWVTPGGIQLRRVSESPLGEPALEATYEQTEGQIQAIVRRLGSTNLAQAGRLNFDIASQNETTMAVSLETKKPGMANGTRYHITIFPPGGREVFHVSLKLSDFQGPGKLDPALLRSLGLADIAANAGGGAGRNTIWIGNVRMTPDSEAK